MKFSVHDTLKRILEIIHFDGDADAHIKDFITACQAYAARDMKEETPEAFEKSLEATTEQLFEEYLKAIIPKLTDEERKNLGTYLAGIVDARPA